jgi:Na+-driven multidrug efflux pump
LGPAEVAAWGLLGTLWDVFENVTESVADACEVRVAMLLGAGRPEKAKMSAYKCIYLGLFVALFLSSVLFILGDEIPTWLTNDVTLQRLLAELIPLFGIGNIGLTVGTISWTAVGAQGRYRLATGIGFGGSWYVSSLH